MPFRAPSPVPSYQPLTIPPAPFPDPSSPSLPYLLLTLSLPVHYFLPPPFLPPRCFRASSLFRSEPSRVSYRSGASSSLLSIRALSRLHDPSYFSWPVFLSMPGLASYTCQKLPLALSTSCLAQPYHSDLSFVDFSAPAPIKARVLTPYDNDDGKAWMLLVLQG